MAPRRDLRRCRRKPIEQARAGRAKPRPLVQAITDQIMSRNETKELS